MNGQEVRRAARQAGPGVEWLARAGYAARGAVYLVIAALTVRASRGGHAPGGARDALNTMDRQPGGDWLLGLLAVGLAGFALWRFVQAALDPENKGRKGAATGAAHRFRYFGSGVVHAGLALAAARAATGGTGGRDGGWYNTALSPLGRFAVGAAGLAFLGYGAYQLWRAYTSHLDRQLDLSGVSSASRIWIVRAARAGLTARGVVFILVGLLLAQAALRQRAPEDRPGLAGALHTLREQPFGPYLILAVAIGLAGYGLFELVRARYRRIHPA